MTKFSNRIKKSSNSSIVILANDYNNKIPKLEAYLYPLIEIIPIQLLSYYIALENNTDPDYPRNLAKSVTVK